MFLNTTIESTCLHIRIRTNYYFATNTKWWLTSVLSFSELTFNCFSYCVYKNYLIFTFVLWQLLYVYIKISQAFQRYARWPYFQKNLNMKEYLKLTYLNILTCKGWASARTISYWKAKHKSLYLNNVLSFSFWGYPKHTILYHT